MSTDTTETTIPAQPKKAKKPKAPTDHKPKATKSKTPKVIRTERGAIVTVRGMQVTIVREAFDDWELLEALGELDKDNPKSIGILPGLMKRALAPEDHAKVMEHLRDENGRVRLTAGVEFFLELFKAASPNG